MPEATKANSLNRRKKNAADESEMSELGRQLREVRRRIAANPNIKLLTDDEIRKEVQNRRTGNDWDEFE